MTKSMRNEAMARRDEVVAMAMKRKEGYLGARVPKELRDRIMQRAEVLGVPVSILIRNILEESFKGDESEVLPQPVLSTGGAAGARSMDRFDSVLGWGCVVLNKPALCMGCGVDLLAGEEATLGFGAARPVMLCHVCKAAI